MSNYNSFSIEVSVKFDITIFHYIFPHFRFMQCCKQYLFKLQVPPLEVPYTTTYIVFAPEFVSPSPLSCRPVYHYVSPHLISSCPIIIHEFFFYFPEIFEVIPTASGWDYGILNLSP